MVVSSFHPFFPLMERTEDVFRKLEKSLFQPEIVFGCEETVVISPAVALAFFTLLILFIGLVLV